MIDTPKIPDPAISTVAPKVSGMGSGAIHQIKPDMLIDALVTRHDYMGNPVLKTAIGDITVASQLDLRNGSNVVLQVLINTKLPHPVEGSQLPYNFQAKIVTIDGKTPLPPANQPAAHPAGPTGYNVVTGLEIHNSDGTKSSTQSLPQANASQMSGQNVRSDASVLNVSNGMMLESVVVSPDKSGAKLLPTNGTNLRPADTVILHVLSVKLPENADTTRQINTNHTQPTKDLIYDNKSLNVSPNEQGNKGVGAERDGAVPRKTANQTMARNPYRTTPPPPTILPGQEMPVSKTAQDVPTKTVPVTQNPTFSGNVVGTEKSGEIFIKTPLGTLKLAPDLILPKNTQLSLEVVRFSTSPAQNLTVNSGDGLNLNNLMNEQKSLIDSLVSSSVALGKEATRDVAARLPSADKQFFSKLLWFIASARNSDEKLWLGKELVQNLEQNGKGDLLNSLQTHFATLGRTMEGGQNNNWTLMLFPFFDGEKIQSGTMFRKKGKKDEGDKDGDRFIVEVELSHVGEVQIDGFIKELPQGKELDFFVRSKLEMDAAMKNGIRDIFLASTEIMGINGGIHFQQVENFPMNPAQEMGMILDNSGSIVV